MSTMRAIVTALSITEDPVVLATVVQITGSSYGGVGTRMVIDSDGSTIGIVSGGCLESDLAEHAKQVLSSHVPRIVTYDTRADDDAAWGLGLGCNGLIEILLEPLFPEEARKVAQLLSKGLEAKTKSVLVTVIASSDTSAVGAHALFTESETATTGEWSEWLVDQVRAESNETFPESRRGLVREYDGVTLAFEVIQPSTKLVICGSGPDVVPLLKYAAQLGWNLTVVDHRPASAAHPERFPGASVIDCENPLDLARRAMLDPQSAVVVMSHHYGRDLDYVRATLNSPAPYIGILGPRARTERMLADISAAGGEIRNGERIYSPVGIDIGSDGPDSIALAIVAEVAAVMSGRGGGHLRDRTGSLHGTSGPNTERSRRALRE